MDDVDEQYVEYADCTGEWKVKEKPTIDDPNGGLKIVISLHALLGTSDSRTMRVQGKIKQHFVILLVDSGSIHNFIDQALVKRLHCQVHNISNIRVSMANGNKLWTKGIYKMVLWETQGFQ